MARAAEALRIPVVSGNVSLYNETDGRAIQPAPVVGCVGLVPDVSVVPGRWREGDVVLLAGAPEPTLAWSEYQALYGEPGGARPRLDLGAERGWSSSSGGRRRSFRSRTTCPAAGSAVALAEAALWSGVGAEVDLPDDLPAWFGEGGGQAVIACARGGRRRGSSGVPLRELGRRRRRPAARGPAAGAGAGMEGTLMCGVLGSLRPRPRRRAARPLRAARAPAPRPGVGRDRRLRRGPPDRAPRYGPRRAGVQRAEAQRPARPARDRPHALLDHRLRAVVERAADRPARPRPHRRARAQRQPGQRGRAA